MMFHNSRNWIAAMLKLYGVDLSPPVNKVRFTLNYLKLEFDYHRVNFKDGENKTEAYLNLHPAGKVPVLVDGDFAIFESDVIIRYLARREQSSLYPIETIQDQAIVDQWMAFSSGHIGGAVTKVLFNTHIHKLYGVDSNQQEHQEGLSLLNRFLPVIDQQLAVNHSLCGQQLTLADLVLLAHLDPAEVCKIDLSPYAHLKAWRNQLKQQSFYQDCYKDYSDLFK